MNDKFHVNDVLILASASRTRADMLRAVGLEVQVDPADIDESEIKRTMLADSASAGETAIVLAEAKARVVSDRHAGALVLGVDQILECDGIWFDKPTSRVNAIASLEKLKGRYHNLFSAAVIISDSQRIWHTLDRVSMSVRSFSPTFLDSYLEAMGDAVMSSVGGYQLEGLGAQLFDAVEGDYFTALGLPLLPLLRFLRDRGLLLQ